MPTKKDLDQFRGDIGENIVAYELMKKGWDVSKHLGGHGYDLTAIKGGVQRRIEVKTTDPALKTGAAKDQLTVVLSASEKDAADFLIFYIHGFNTFYILPRKEFPESGSITVFITKEGDLGQGTRYDSFRNTWDRLD